MKGSPDKETELLVELFNKVLIYRVMRNFDKQVKVSRISHSSLSKEAGFSSNWFNRTYNELKDMKMTALIKAIATVSKILEARRRTEPIDLNLIITPEVLEIATLTIELSSIPIDSVLIDEPNFQKVVVNSKVYVDSMFRNNSIDADEYEAYNRLHEKIKECEEKKNG